MIYAQIKNQIVKNTIVIEDESLSSIFSEGFDQFIRIDQINPRPGIGWRYNGQVWTAPPPQPRKSNPLL